MRLKTLRKERPAFENEGAVISGSRLDLSNNESKPIRYRSNNAFVLPTSLNHELSTLHMSSTDSNDGQTTTTHHLQSASTEKLPLHSNTSQTTTTLNTLPTYQALEAAYLERGIRIHIDPNTAAALNQQQPSSTDRSHGNKSTNILQRPHAFVNRNPSRSSSALQYQVVLPNPNEDGRPFSALQPGSNHDFEGNSHRHNRLYSNGDHQHQEYSTHSVLVSEQSTSITPPEPIRIPVSEIKSIDDDPDLAYMSKLLKTTNGDSFRDTIRRRAGLRGTFAVHRHAETSSKTNTHKTSETRTTMTHSSTGQRAPSQRQPSNMAFPLPTPSTKRVEKDILRHASRIRTSQSKEYYSRQGSSPIRQQKFNQTPSVSTSPTRIYHREIKRTKIKKLPKPISLEPLELLLAPDMRPSTSPVRTRSTSAYDLNSSSIEKPATERTSKKVSLHHSKSGRLYSDDILRSLYVHAHSNPSILSSNDSLSLMKTSPLYIIATTKSNSYDSGCYDRSSGSYSSHDAPSANSSHFSPAFQSPYPIRLNSAKKVAFDEQSSTFVLTTATYV